MRRCAADSCASCTAYALMRADHCARDRNLAYANSAYGPLASLSPQRLLFYTIVVLLSFPLRPHARGPLL